MIWSRSLRKSFALKILSGKFQTCTFWAKNLVWMWTLIFKPCWSKNDFIFSYRSVSSMSTIVQDVMKSRSSLQLSIMGAKSFCLTYSLNFYHSRSYIIFSLLRSCQFSVGVRASRQNVGFVGSHPTKALFDWNESSSALCSFFAVIEQLL